MFVSGDLTNHGTDTHMKILLASLLLILSLGVRTYGQGYTIKGTVSDTLLYKPLYLSSVVLMRGADSVLETFTRTAEDGGFTLKVPEKGRYILEVSYPGFGDFVDVVNVTDNITNVGAIPMSSKEHLLKEFVLTQQVAAIKIKGDTTEYMADSFKMKDNATVEDLLKKLPGIQVDKNGKVTAQGETVQKILVDGEEFFSDDPKVVTQGLQANAVTKVQVYDKKSDQAEFTGIDDGEKTKTINLELKESRKHGYFGKADMGGGTDGYFQDQLMVNAFKGKRQISVFGIASNTDKVGLGWGDNDKFGGGNGIMEQVDENNWTMYGGSYDEFGGWDGKYSGDGLPKVWTGGVHYADRWNEDKDHLSGSYRYSMQNVEIGGSNSSIFSLPGDTTRVNTERKNQFNSGQRHGVNLLYEWKIDTNTSLKFTVEGGTKDTKTASIDTTETYNIVGGENGPKTTNGRTVIATSSAQFINSNLLFRKKFKKKGRTLSLDFAEDYKDSKGGGSLYSYITNADSSAPQITDQRKVENTNTLALRTKATYTEPLSKTAFIEANYGVTVDNSTALNSSYNKAPNGNDYTVLQDSFSSNYKYNILVNRGGLNLKFVYKTINFNFGGDVSNAGYLQTDMLHGDTTHTYNYVNFFPKASFTYKISKQTSLRFSYSGNTKQPTIAQIQPLNQNTDPLNISVGNPGLKQEFDNSFNLRFNNYKVLTHTYSYVGLSYNTISDAITTSQVTNGAVNTTQYVNVNGNYSANGYADYGFKLKKPEISIGFSFNGNINHINNFVNYEHNTSDNTSYTFGPDFRYEKEEKYEFSWTPGATYNTNTSTINVNPVNYWVFNNEFRADVQVTKTFEIGSNVNVMLRQQTSVFTSNNNVVKWNAFVGKKFLKKKELELKASVFDILNQNVGYTRTATGNVITQNNSNTIRRYGMLSLVWNFTHTPKAEAAPEDKK